MRATPAPFPSRVRSAAVAVQALAIATALALLAPGAAPPASGSAVALTEPRPTTRFQISSFNLLGAAHTEADGNKPAYASGAR